MSLVIETIELVAGVGVAVAGLLGILRTKIDLWKIPFVLFVITGVFMSATAFMNACRAFGLLPFDESIISAVLSVGRVLLILAVAYLTYMLALLYERSSFGVMMLSRDGFRNIVDRLRKMYGRTGAKQILYSTGKEVEYSQMRGVLARWNITDESFLKWLPSLYTVFGWGSKLSVVEYQRNKKLVLRTKDNFEMNPHADNGAPSCDFTRGIFAGLGRALAPEVDSETIETKCQSRGDEYCQFEINLYQKNKM